MPIIDTHKWLRQYMKKKQSSFKDNLRIQSEVIGDHLTDYFENATPFDIHQHLLSHGMFIPDPLDKQVISDLIENNMWTSTRKILLDLRKLWDGPDVPVFLLPSDHTNRALKSDFNGRSGLSYRDKVFLFITNHTSKQELEALLTHEYNHVCRLSFIGTPDEELNLLDALVLEGIAEHAVINRLGEDSLSKWTTLYSEEFAQQAWKRWIAPNLYTKKTSKKHEQIMYGSHGFPKWLGYNIGYHLVTSYIENHNTSIEKLLRLPSKNILSGSAFKLD